MASAAPEFFEPIAMADIFCSGLAKVEDIGDGLLRYHFFVHQQVAGQAEKVITVKIVMPVGAVSDSIAKQFAAVNVSPEDYLARARLQNVPH